MGVQGARWLLDALVSSSPHSVACISWLLSSHRFLLLIIPLFPPLFSLSLTLSLRSVFAHPSFHGLPHSAPPFSSHRQVCPERVQQYIDVAPEGTEEQKVPLDGLTLSHLPFTSSVHSKQSLFVIMLMRC